MAFPCAPASSVSDQDVVDDLRHSLPRRRRCCSGAIVRLHLRLQAELSGLALRWRLGDISARGLRAISGHPPPLSARSPLLRAKRLVGSPPNFWCCLYVIVAALIASNLVEHRRELERHVAFLLDLVHCTLLLTRNRGRAGSRRCTDARVNLLKVALHPNAL